MGKKGTPHRYFSKEFKLAAVKNVLAGQSAKAVGKKLDVGGDLVRAWVKKYLEEGEHALEPKRKPGNPLCRYIHRKELSETDRLRYELAKAEVEIAKLKKAYELQRR